MEEARIVTETFLAHRNSPARAPRADYLYDFSRPFEAFDGAVQELDLGLIHLFAGVRPRRFAPREGWLRADRNIRAHFNRVTDHIFLAASTAYEEPLSQGDHHEQLQLDV